MSKISVEEASRNLKVLLEEVAAGKEVIIVDRDKPVARLVSPILKEEWLAKMKEFRNSLSIKGEPLSTTVIKGRGEERY